MEIGGVNNDFGEYLGYCFTVQICHVGRAGWTSGLRPWFAPYKMTECPRLSKTPEKLEFLEFDPHKVEISFLIFRWEGARCHVKCRRVSFFSLHLTVYM